MRQQKYHAAAKIIFNIRHNMMPAETGMMNARAVHLKLPVSFFIVRHVVPHGK